MMRRVLPGMLLLSALSGCVEENWLRDRWARVSGEPNELPAVTPNPFGQAVSVAAPHRTALSPASLDSAARVDTLGRHILAGNPQLGLKPLFITIGSPESEVFHVGTTEVYVTEGLVKKCTTEAQLAAILCNELGKMVAAREALAGPQLRVPDRPPPREMRVGNDHGGNLGAADQVYRAELAKFEKDHRPSPAHPLPNLNPRTLAETYLYRAGHDPKELDAVVPLLKEAAENRTFARQMSGGVQPARTWTR
jgi:hypothetical protein